MSGQCLTGPSDTLSNIYEQKNPSFAVVVMVMNAILRHWCRGVKARAGALAEVNMDTGGLAGSGERLLQHG